MIEILLSPKNWLIAIIVGCIVFTGYKIYSYYNLVTELQGELDSKKTTITNLKATIDIQNQAIEAASSEMVKTQNRLNEVYKRNKVYVVQNAALKRKLESKPLATTCEEAITEVKVEFSNIAKEWNQ